MVKKVPLEQLLFISSYFGSFLSSKRNEFRNGNTKKEKKRKCGKNDKKILEHQFERDDRSGSFILVMVLRNGIPKWPLTSRQSVKVLILQILLEQLVFLSEACDLVFDAASQGKSFLIVGTKKKSSGFSSISCNKVSLSLC
uniref:Uncharacterized protein n=1 Tax=Zea mays TaxID=4577 RepID=A0A804RRI9_MAIZE